MSAGGTGARGPGGFGPPALRLAAGEAVYHEGDRGDRMYVVEVGRIELRSLESGRRVVGPGSLFGERALVADGRRRETARALTRAELVVVDARRFLLLIRQNPYFALRVMAGLAAGDDVDARRVDPR